MQIRHLPLIVALPLAIVAFSSLAAPSCEESVDKINNQLKQQLIPAIENEQDLANVLRYLATYSRLPDRYITTIQARQLGWSGNASESLWGLKRTNGKWIGGDAYQRNTDDGWFSADIDVYRGYHSNKRLIYNVSRQERFVTTDNFVHLNQLQPCQ